MPQGAYTFRIYANFNHLENILLEKKNLHLQSLVRDILWKRKVVKNLICKIVRYFLFSFQFLYFFYNSLYILL